MEDTPNASAQQKGLPAADVKAWHENEYARPPPVHGFLCAGPGAFFGPCHTLCRHSSRAQCTDRSAPRTGVSAGARSAPAGLDAADFRAPPGGEETAQERMHRHHRLLKACSWRIEKDQRGSWTLCPPRNHRRLVAFISWMVLGVGANCDIQVRSAAWGGSEAGSVCEISSSRAHPPTQNALTLRLNEWGGTNLRQVILDHHALIRYILKYQFKGEKVSNAYLQSFKGILEQAAQRGDSTKRTFCQAMNKSNVSRDYGAYETMHLLQGQELVECSRIFVRPCRRVAQHEATSSSSPLRLRPADSARARKSAHASLGALHRCLFALMAGARWCMRMARPP